MRELRRWAERAAEPGADRAAAPIADGAAASVAHVSAMRSSCARESFLTPLIHGTQ